MWHHDHKVLEDFQVSPPQWAILLAASYYTPVSRDHLLDLAMLESDFSLTEEELTTAFDGCSVANWIEPYYSVERTVSWDKGEDVPASGWVLTERGTTLKERVLNAYHESVPVV